MPDRELTRAALTALCESEGWDVAQEALRERRETVKLFLARGRDYTLEEIRGLQGQFLILDMLCDRESALEFLTPAE